MLNWNENMEKIMQEMKRVKMPQEVATDYLWVLQKDKNKHLQPKILESIKTTKTVWEMEEKLVDLITRKNNDE